MYSVFSIFGVLGFVRGLLTAQTASEIEAIVAKATRMKSRGLSVIKLRDKGRTGWIVG